MNRCARELGHDAMRSIVGPGVYWCGKWKGGHRLINQYDVADKFDAIACREPHDPYTPETAYYRKLGVVGLGAPVVMRQLRDHPALP